MNSHAATTLHFQLLPIILVGCATALPLLMSEPVGAAPHMAVVAEQSGQHVVYSVWDIFPGGESDYRYREDCVLNWSGDVRVEKVRIHDGTFDQGPVADSLPPGTCQIKARATGRVKVTASAVIETGQTTSAWLPNGQMIGWRATR